MSFKPGVDGPGSIAQLQAQFQFSVLWEPSAQTGFLADLTEAQIAAIQCDPRVAFLEWDAVGTLGDHSLPSRQPRLRFTRHVTFEF